MAKERKYPTATPKPQRYEFRNVKGEPHMVQFKVCGKWFSVSRNFFNQHFDRDSKRPARQGQ